MDNKKQKLLIEYLISSNDTFAICQGVVEPDYFDPEFRNAVAFVKSYYNEYNTTPSAKQIDAETGVDLETVEISKDQIEYTTNEIETFCKRRALEKAVLASPKLIEDGEWDQVLTNVKDALLISLHKELGLRYYEDVQERLDRMLNETPTHPTGWTEVDALLYGGISRKEFLLISANSGGGKSITLSNLGYNFAQSGMNVLYLSLELSQDVIAQRFDTLHTGISRKEWKSHVSEIVTRVEANGETSGVIDIVQMKSGTTANQIQGYLKEYYLTYDIMPDLLIVDYLDKMHPNEKVDMSDAFTKDKLCSEQLRDLGVEYNMFVASASQLNRCLCPDTIVTLADYSETQLRNISVGDSLLSWDPDTQQFGANTVTNKCEEQYEYVYEIQLEDGSTVTCSDNHVWPTADGEKSISTGLAVNDVLFVR